MKDVIISGAGPVGVLARELAWPAVQSDIGKVRGSHSPLKQLPFRIRALSAPTILDRRGLLEELDVQNGLKTPIQLTAQGSRRQVGHFASIPFYEDNIDCGTVVSLPSSTDTILISEMEELETVLARRAGLRRNDRSAGSPSRSSNLGWGDRESGDQSLKVSGSWSLRWKP